MLPARIPKRPKRESRWRSQAHTAHVRSFCCAFCGSATNIEAAHVRMNSGTGMSQKPDDWLTTPLCSGPFSNIDGQLGCHQMQHGVGEPEFWQKYFNKHGQSVWQLIEELIASSPKRGEILRVRKERALAA